MLRVRSKLSVRQPDESRLVIRSSGGRRLLFGAIATILVIAFLVGVNWRVDFRNAMLGGTIFYLVITLISVSVAGWSSVLVVDRRSGRIAFVKSIFGLRIRHEAIELTSISAVVLQAIHLLRDSEQPRAGMASSRFRDYMERRSVLFKLMLETNERLAFVDDSADSSDLESAGNALADFLGVPFRREET